MALFEIQAAAQVLVEIGWPQALAVASVGFWSIVDIAIAIAVTLLVRKLASYSCWAMVATSLIYLVSATLTVPGLWSDPLGPLVKVLPAIVLALVARAMLEAR